MAAYGPASDLRWSNCGLKNETGECELIPLQSKTKKNKKTNKKQANKHKTKQSKTTTTTTKQNNNNNNDKAKQQQQSKTATKIKKKERKTQTGNDLTHPPLQSSHTGRTQVAGSIDRTTAGAKDAWLCSHYNVRSDETSRSIRPRLNYLIISLKLALV